MASEHPDQPGHDEDWIRSERRSFWIALGIALAPIPAALLISWVLGSPPGGPGQSPEHDPTLETQEAPDDLGGPPPGYPAQP